MAEALDSYFDWTGHEVIDSGGELIGRLERLFFDRETDRPKWALISSGPLGGDPMLAPLQGAAVDENRLRLDFPRQVVWDAPGPGSSRKPDAAEEAQLYRHYQVEPDLGDVIAERRGPPIEELPAEDDVTLTRSEEEVAFRLASRVRERVRVVKEVVTEEVTEVVPVRREEVRLVREPAPADSDPERVEAPFEEEEPLELTLMEEQVVVEKRVVPRERVRVYKETITEERDVAEPVRKERVDVVEEPAP